MNEKSSKRREWVKTVAIIFLSILLVLTFFSQTIMNYSLPEVSTEYAQNGTITTKVRGSGTVESGSLYEVKPDSTLLGRKIMEVTVRVGDKINKGDVILELAEGDSNDIEQAKQEIEDARSDLKSAREYYDSKLLSKDTTLAIIQQAHSNISTDTLRNQITQMQQDREAAEINAANRKEELKKRIAAFETQIEWTTDEEKNNGIEAEIQAVKDAEKAKKATAEALKAASDALAAAEKELADARESGASASKIEKLEQKVAKAKEKKEKAQEADDKAQKAVDKAKERKEKKKKELLASLRSQKEALEEELENLGDPASDIDEKLTQFTEDLVDAKDLRKLYEDVVEAQKKVVEAQEKLTKLQTETKGSQVLADISGTVTSVNVTAGNKLESGEICVLQPVGKGYTMKFSVTTEQAKKLSVGDKAELVNAWYYDDMSITLSSIKPDKKDPGKQKELTFDIEGEVREGQNLQVSVGQNSQQYEHIVPNSAIREDNNGKFILTVQSKSSPLGNRYIAQRVDVQVLASDDTKSAVSGALEGWEFVITTATKPVEAGQQVRLAE